MRSSRSATPVQHEARPPRARASADVLGHHICLADRRGPGAVTRPPGGAGPTTAGRTRRHRPPMPPKPPPGARSASYLRSCRSENSGGPSLGVPFGRRTSPTTMATTRPSPIRMTIHHMSTPLRGGVVGQPRAGNCPRLVDRSQRPRRRRRPVATPDGSAPGCGASSCAPTNLLERPRRCSSRTCAYTSPVVVGHEPQVRAPSQLERRRRVPQGVQPAGSPGSDRDRPVRPQDVLGVHRGCRSRSWTTSPRPRRSRREALLGAGPGAPTAQSQPRATRHRPATSVGLCGCTPRSVRPARATGRPSPARRRGRRLTSAAREPRRAAD